MGPVAVVVEKLATRDEVGEERVVSGGGSVEAANFQGIGPGSGQERLDEEVKDWTGVIVGKSSEGAKGIGRAGGVDGEDSGFGNGDREVINISAHFERAADHVVW